MDDKEIALELGRRLFRAKLIIEAMNVELNLAREYPGRRSTEQIVEEVEQQILLPAYADRLEGLRQRLDASTPDRMMQTLALALDQLI